MARDRLELSDIFRNILGSSNVYFQPPESVKMKYPAILYERSDKWIDNADNIKYRNFNQYTVTVIDPDPDSLIPEKVLEIPYCNMDRHYVADNLNHDVFTLYF